MPFIARLQPELLSHWETDAMRPAVFLDRDGVLNEVVLRDGSWVSPRRCEEFMLCRGVEDAADALRQAGCLVFVITNQPDVARGLMSADTLEAMNERIRVAVAPDEIWSCTHDDADRCICRKPLPGALVQIAHRWDVDLARSVMIGDTGKDVGAGRAAGVTTILLDRTYNQGIDADHRVADLDLAIKKAIQISNNKETSPCSRPTMPRT
jgi:D-glycero-D-manno-heptose 1,7-bisphosphate phosphatase